VLARHFIEKLRDRTCSPVSGVSEEAVEVPGQGYHWPGNVRELENVVERALVLADREELTADDLPPFDHGQGRMSHRVEPELTAEGLDLNQVVEGMEERLLRQALRRADGVKAEAARLLGLKPSALYYKLEKYGIEA
jgi:two-component system, NtrC family, response regulator HydG